MDTALTVQNLTIGYTHPLVKNINFSLKKGDFLLIKGRNGIGKTTLIHTILGIQKPIEGSIDTLGLKVGYLPQSNHITVSSTVIEIVMSSFAAQKNFFGAKERQIAVNILRDLGIQDLENISVLRLSGGQLQKTLLARLLVLNPEIIILDEPQNNLDAEAQQVLNLELQKLKEAGKTIIAISHNEEFSDLATHTLLFTQIEEITETKFDLANKIQ